MRRNLILCFIIAAITLLHGQNDSVKFYAGFRASRVLSSYPNNQFPQTEYWIRVAKEMSQKFPGSTPAGIWILSLYQSAGVTQLSFPSGGLSIPNIQFTSVDYNESHLAKLDTSGVKVWLQVEPGAASMDTLISVVLNRYKQHSSVIGFGVDVEWFFANTNTGGRKLTDSMVARWEQKVKSVDTNYTLFIKHYSQSWMPQTYRGKVLFVDDSQDFNYASNPFNTMVSEFKSWGTKFSPNRSAFQFGYAKDSTWWGKFADQTKTIGDALRTNIASCGAVFWVDFTVMKVFPPTFVRLDEPVPVDFSLSQNYPNPFNPTTMIQFSIPNAGTDGNPFRNKANSIQTTLKIYDVLGNEMATLVNGQKEPGTYSVQWNATQFATGLYFAKLQSGSNVQLKKMMLLK